MLRFNDKNEILREEEYRAIIVGLQLKEDVLQSMDELEGLCEADGIEVAGRVIQSLDKANAATLIGRGKVAELADMCENMEIDTVVFNDELSGAQIRNLEDQLKTRVIDRTILILDIFADRAVSREGKLQVELAQLQYRMPRLTGFGKALSRLGGGIGTRGPGEKKLETDRRHISGRIDDIKEELRKIGKTRQTQRSEREKSGIPVVALMGYTNSGKSAIMNALISAYSDFAVSTELSDKQVKSQDMLFATLDAQHRRISFGKGEEFVLIDTVGFVSRLPHGLVEAFKSTLEEVRDADLLVHVVDSSRADRDFQIEVTEKVIKQMAAQGTPVIMAYNKMDITDEKPVDYSSNTVFVSASTGAGLTDLAAMIRKQIFGDRKQAVLLVPYDRGNIVSYLCDKGQVDSISYDEAGTRIEGRFAESDLNRYRQYEV